MKSGMSDIIANWFFYGQGIFDHTIFPTLLIYGIIFMFCKIWKNGWFLTKQPFMNHVMNCLIINFVISAVYIYNLPIKVYKHYNVSQNFRLYDNIPITSVDAIELFGLYVITLLVIFFLLNKALEWWYTKYKASTQADPEVVHKRKHSWNIMNRKVYWICFALLLLIGAQLKSSIRSGVDPVILGVIWTILLFIVVILRLDYIGYSPSKKIMIILSLFIPFVGFIVLIYIGCKKYVSYSRNDDDVNS